MKYILIGSTLLGGVLLYLINKTIVNTAISANYYTALLLFSVLFAMLLLVLIAKQLFTLHQNVRRNVVGGRFGAKLLGIFALFALIPGLIVYLVSVHFLMHSIESWFNTRVEVALEGGVKLGQTVLDTMLANMRSKAELMATDIALRKKAHSPLQLNVLRKRSEVNEVILLNEKGDLVDRASDDNTRSLVPMPSISELENARGNGLAEIYNAHGNDLYFRVLTPIPMPQSANHQIFLELIEPVPPALEATAQTVHMVYRDYQNLYYNHSTLKKVFAATLTLVMVLTLLNAVAIALVLSRRLSEPLAMLAQGTQAIAHGNYKMSLPEQGSDELGTLVHSFNSMALQLNEVTMLAHNSRLHSEAAREYLETILSHLSSGVLALDAESKLRICNEAAIRLLAIDVDQYLGLALGALVAKEPRLAEFVGAVTSNIRATKTHRPMQIELPIHGSKQILILRGTHLPDGGYVVIFNNVTDMIRAQREAAWGEAARRLAHEISNPLTPIRLAAERLALKLRTKLQPAEAEVLQRVTDIIVHQVDAMKAMVNEFREYARAPLLEMEILDFNQLMREILELYQPQQVIIESRLTPGRAMIRGSSMRLRQVLLNLLQNAQDALVNTKKPRIIISTIREQGKLKLRVADNGTGFLTNTPLEALEPYVTTKAHGTGLGLAIVKKIIDEHQGTVLIENNGGATVTIVLPLLQEK